MKTILLFIAAISTPGLQMLGADADLKNAISAAARKLADQPSFTWKTTTMSDAPGPFGGGGATSGQTEREGYTRISASSPGGEPLDFVMRAGKVAVLFEENWLTMDQASQRGGGGGGAPGFNRAVMANFKTPVAQAEEYLAKAAGFTSAGDKITGSLGPEWEARGPFGRQTRAFTQAS